MARRKQKGYRVFRGVRRQRGRRPKERGGEELGHKIGLLIKAGCKAFGIESKFDTFNSQKEKKIINRKF